MTNTQKIQNLINSFSRKTVNVKEAGETKLTITAPIALLIAILFTKPTVIAVLAAMALGYKFSISTRESAGEAAADVPADAETVNAAE